MTNYHFLFKKIINENDKIEKSKNGKNALICKV